jgi:alpha-methylacyl-CoA racemase
VDRFRIGRHSVGWFGVSGRWFPVSGPLEGVRIVELAGLGPAPFAGMMLADAGADVIRIDRAAKAAFPPLSEPHVDLMNRGRRSVAVDLKHPEGVELVLRLAGAADGLMEGFRPGVAERLGIGPKECMERNPALVYGRMTGWGQEGPMASTAGHDIDYISLAGALEPMGRAGERPVPPLNLVGDFGGGGMMLAFGMCAAIISARQTGAGQVVDAAMVDGAAALMTMTFTLRQAGVWLDERGTNLLDTGAHFYEVYETADGGYLSVGAIEGQFYAELILLLELEGEDLPDQNDRSQWPAMKERFAALFATRTRAEWEEVFEGSDACVAPVLSLAEAPEHPHNKLRGTFTEVAGVLQPAPAPRFTGTPGAIRRPPPNPGQHADEALSDWGLSDDEVAGLRATGAIR